ncbi:hypothetical protein KAONASHI_00490 [Serratia phage vB_SmaP-Kaonashi]|nr:hypothetical protein KAONASHI_00490 [Serratia phage vB_SmaP-Kaonashi]
MLRHVTQRFRHTLNTQVANDGRNISQQGCRQLTHHVRIDHVGQALYQRGVIQSTSAVEQQVANVLSSLNLLRRSAIVTHSVQGIRDVLLTFPAHLSQRHTTSSVTDVAHGRTEHVMLEHIQKVNSLAINHTAVQHVQFAA